MRALSLLIKPVSSNCNIRCRYCFYSDVVSLREDRNNGIMPLENLEIFIKKALNEVTEQCSFGFQGGEPLLAGLDFFEKLVEMQKKYNIHGVKITNSVQTNGILINDEWAEFFAKHKFLIGLSLDGDHDIHNLLRVDSKNNGTFLEVMESVKIFNHYNVDYNILSVITKQLAAQPEEVYKFYKNNNFRFIQLIPCIEHFDETQGSNFYSLESSAYGNFLKRIFDLWYEDFIHDNYYSFRNFDNYIRMLMGEMPDSCAMSGVCQSYPVIESDVSLYPCDFYAFDKYRIGNILTDSFEQALRRALFEC